PALVRAGEAVDHDREQGRARLVGYVPDLVSRRTERPEQVPLPFHAFRQDAAAAHAHHLRTARLFSPFGRAGNVSEILGLRGVGDIDDRSSVALDRTGERVRHLARVVADVGDVAPVFADDDGLVRGTPLQVAVTGQHRVPRGLLIRGFGRRLSVPWAS